MKLICLLLTITVLHFTARAQTFAWAKSMGGSGNVYPSDRCHSVITDPNGNVYTAGNFVGTTDFDPGPGTFNLTAMNGGGGLGSDVFIQKLDSAGNFVWAKQIVGDSASGAFDLTIDATGNIYITGFYRHIKDFDPGPGTYYLTSTWADVFVLKLDGNGNFIWAKSMGGPGNEGAFSIELDNTGEVYIAGRFNGTVDFDPGPNTYILPSAGDFDIFVCKVDNAGNFLWAHSTGSPTYDEANAITVDNSGNIYVTGRFMGTVDFDPGSGVYNLTSSGDNLYIWKLSSAGNFIWVKQITGGFSNGLSIKIDAAFNVYYVGRFSGADVDLDPGLGVLNLGNGGHIISKLDVGGNLQWVRTLLGPAAQTISFAAGAGIALDNDGNIFVTSQFSTTVDFDPGPPTYNLTSYGSDDVFILKLNNSGNFVWATSFGGTSEDNGLGIALNNSGQIYTTGTFRNSVDFDPGSGSYPLTAVAQEDIFIHKLHQAPCAFLSQPGAITGNASTCSGTSQAYSINSVTGATSYTWILPNGWTGNSTTNSINVTTGTNSGNISVVANNSCGGSSAQTLAVIASTIPAIPIGINGNSSVNAGQSVSYSINPVTGANGYNWSVSGGGTITTGQNTTSVTINWSTAGNYTLSVNATNNCGTSSNQTLNVAVSIPTAIFNPDNQFQIKITPNPSDGEFYLTAKGVINKGIKVEIIDMLGRILYTDQLVAHSNDFSQLLNLKKLAAGIYNVRIIVNKKIYSRPILKTN